MYMYADLWTVCAIDSDIVLGLVTFYDWLLPLTGGLLTTATWWLPSIP